MWDYIDKINCHINNLKNVQIHITHKIDFHCLDIN